MAAGDVTLAAAALRRKPPRLPPLRAAVITSGRAELQADALAVALAAGGFAPELMLVGNYDFAAAMLDDAQAPDLALVTLHGDDVLGDPQAGATVANLVETLAARTIVVLTEITPPLAGSGAEIAANAELRARLANKPGVRLITNAALAAGNDDWLDARLKQIAGTPFAPKTLIRIAAEAARSAVGAYGRAIKLIVTDLDGTLWPGVIAEDGIEAALADDPGHRALRAELAAAAERGILLGAASHNDRADALAALAHLDELEPDRFAAIEAGWEPKAEMIARLLAHLGLGSDAMLVVDDDPVRAAEIAAAFPSADVRHMRDAAAFAAELALDPLLAGSLAGHDRRALQQRSAEADAARASMSLADFQRSLGMRLSVRPLDQASLARAHELTRRTNQFNATGFKPELAALRGRKGPDLVFHLTDRFGDHGIVGLLLARLEGTTCHIDGLYLSCRALGRGIESAMLAELAARAKALGAARLTGEIAALPRNEPVRDLYARHGFRKAGTGYERDTSAIPGPEFIGIERP